MVAHFPSSPQHLSLAFVYPQTLDSHITYPGARLSLDLTCSSKSESPSLQRRGTGAVSLYLRAFLCTCYYAHRPTANPIGRYSKRFGHYFHEKMLPVKLSKSLSCFPCLFCSFVTIELDLLFIFTGLNRRAKSS
jgi:hypothetical protein